MNPSPNHERNKAIIKFCITPKSTTQMCHEFGLLSGLMFNLCNRLIALGNLEVTRNAATHSSKTRLVYTTIKEEYVYTKKVPVRVEPKSIYNFIPWKADQMPIDHEVPEHLKHCVMKRTEKDAKHQRVERSREKVSVSGSTLMNF